MCIRDRSNYDPRATLPTTCQTTRVGCTDPTAYNFNSAYTVSCVRGEERDGCTPCEYTGCTDSNSVNYDESATINDGLCRYPIYGCTDADKGLNYVANADVDDGSCRIAGCMQTAACDVSQELAALRRCDVANVQSRSFCELTLGGRRLQAAGGVCSDPQAINYVADADDATGCMLSLIHI